MGDHQVKVQDALASAGKPLMACGHNAVQAVAEHVQGGTCPQLMYNMLDGGWLGEASASALDGASLGAGVHLAPAAHAEGARLCRLVLLILHSEVTWLHQVAYMCHADSRSKSSAETHYNLHVYSMLQWSPALAAWQSARRGRPM